MWDTIQILTNPFFYYPTTLDDEARESLDDATLTAVQDGYITRFYSQSDDYSVNTDSSNEQSHTTNTKKKNNNYGYY